MDLDIGLLANLLLPIAILMLGMYFLVFWQASQRRDYELRSRQLALDEQRIRADAEAQANERQHRDMRDDERSRRDEEDAIRKSAGAGTGGFIVMDLSEDQRPLFHDLLNGFEEFARLKGYAVSFSVDATFPNRIAFKFTIREGGISVEPQRVRKDFREYVARVQSGDDLDDIPVVISLDEHELLVTALRNRLSFIQHTYQLQKNVLGFYDKLLDRHGSVAALPTPNVVVQTGGSIDSKTYSAVNSPRLIQGDASSVEEGSSSISIRIGQSFNERAEQVAGLEKLVALVRRESSLAEEHREVVTRELNKVLDELQSEQQPSPSRIKRWLTHAQTVVDLGKMGSEASSVAKSVFESFGT